MPNITYDDHGEETTIASGDFIPFWKTSPGASKKIDSDNLVGALASQAEMEAGTEAALRRMSPLRIAQAIAALASGGGLTNASISPTTADITLSVNTRNFVNASGLTADRALKFPTGSDGDQIEIRMIGQNASYACKLQGDTGIVLENLTATEWDRLWNSGQALGFVYLNGDGWRKLWDNRTYWRKILLTANAANIQFANIPSIYHDMKFTISLRSTKAAIAYDTVNVTVNGLAGTNYEYATFFWNNNAGTPTWGTTTGTGQAAANLTLVPATNAPANSFGTGFLEIEDYSNTNKYKKLHFRGGMHIAHNASGAFLYDSMNEVKTTNAINQVTFSLPSSTNFLAQSEITLTIS